MSTPYRNLPQALLLALALLLPAACRQELTPAWQGYAEGEYVQVASPRSGRLLALEVRKGETAAAGAPLFRLDPEPEATVVSETRQRWRQAQFLSADVERGQRPTELAAVDARLQQARVGHDLALTELQRRERLFGDGAIPREQLDRARAEAERSTAAVSELEAQLATARLGGRVAKRQASGAEAAAVQAALALAEWNLAQKSPLAPVAGLVFDTLFEPGELVPAAAPVVVLLPPTGRKALFYVPEAQRASLHPGSRVVLRFDGGELGATVSYISPEAEFTPPVIYSRETRAKLIYRVEARPEPAAAGKLQPGQPLTVVPEQTP